MKNKALSILQDVKDILPGYFLVLGTALGAVREKDFIMNKMFDIDVGIMSENFKWSYIQEFIKRGYDLHLVLGKRNYGLSIHLSKYDIHLDILLYYKKNDKIWRITWFKNEELYQEFPASAFKIETQRIDGKFFDSLGEEYLECYYGKDWRVPVEDFIWWKFPPSIKERRIDPNWKETKIDIYMNHYG